MRRDYYLKTAIKAVLKKTGREYLTDVWPNLEVFFHGGISFEPYREQYKTLIPSDKMHYMETYNASEGFFGLQDDPTDPSLLMMPDYGIFYEFIPMNEVGSAHPTVLPLESVETGKNYAMVITTSGGLWRYQIGDTVRFTSLFPHKFVISGRTKHFINAFGEAIDGKGPLIKGDKPYFIKSSPPPAQFRDRVPPPHSLCWIRRKDGTNGLSSLTRNRNLSMNSPLY